MEKTFEIKTRIMGQPDGSSELILTVNNGWRISYRFTVKDSKDLRAYLKSDEFKEYAYSVFSKYEGMTYDDVSKLWENDKTEEFQKISDKLDAFCIKEPAKPAEEEFKVDFYLKLIKRCTDGIVVNVNFCNNIDGRRLYFKIFLRTKTSPYLVSKDKSRYLMSWYYGELYGLIWYDLLCCNTWDGFMSIVDRLRMDVYDVADCVSYDELMIYNGC